MRTSLFALSLLIGMSQAAPPPLVVAHRGASHDAPENSLAAFRKAWADGADAIEGDFHLTVDGQILCFHDFDTKKFGGDPPLVLAATAAEELQALDIGSAFGEAFAGERMPLFTDVLATVPADGLFFIEVKCGPEILDPMFALLDASELRDDQLVIISFQEDVIAEVKRQRPQYRANWLRSLKTDSLGRMTPDLDTILPVLSRIGADGLSTSAHEQIDAAWVARVKAAGFGYHVWTVDDPAVARRFADLGAESVTTNVPAVIKRTLEKE